jgi:hypothetical protein
MKRAHQFREYRNVRPFSPPDGVVSVEIDPASGQLAMPQCPDPRPEFFITGTQPVESCRLHGGGGTRVAQWDVPPAHPGGTVAVVPAKPEPIAQPARVALDQPRPVEPKVLAAEETKPEEPKKKRGFFGRLGRALGVTK